MKQKDIITYALIAGGAYALYWYVNNYGPAGKVAIAGGKGSYWDSWLGAQPVAQQSLAQPAAPTQPAAAASAQYTAPSAPAPTPVSATNPPAAPAQYTAPSAPAAFTPATGPVSNSLRDALIAASAPATSLNLDQWSYYIAQVSGKPVDGSTIAVMIQTIGGDRTKNIDADTYLKLLALGLAGSLPSTSASSGIPGFPGSSIGDIVETRSLTKSQGMAGQAGQMRFKPAWGKMPIPGMRWVN